MRARRWASGFLLLIAAGVWSEVMRGRWWLIVMTFLIAAVTSALGAFLKFLNDEDKRRRQG